MLIKFKILSSYLHPSHVKKKLFYYLQQCLLGYLDMTAVELCLNMYVKAAAITKFVVLVLQLVILLFWSNTIFSCLLPLSKASCRIPIFFFVV